MAETGFVIDGISYDVPTLDSFDMDEAEILYKCSGLTLEDFAVDEEDPEASAQLLRNIRNPGFMRTLMLVAYIRGNAGATFAKANSIIGRSNFLEVIKELGEEADAGPPELTKTGNGTPGGAASTESSSDPSGGTSIEGLAAQEDPRVATGTSA